MMNDDEKKDDVTILELCNIDIPFDFTRRKIIYSINNGCIALMWSCRKNNTEIVSYLLEYI